MPPQIARLVGSAGAGKTRELLNIMDLAVQRLHDPRLIGFCSFSRAARREASTRAADQYDMKPADLEQHGWFRTLHCSPPGEPVLTVNRGYVPIEKLDPEVDVLVTYFTKTNNVMRGARGTNGNEAKRYRFRISERAYSGAVYKIKTADSETCVTTGHRLRVRMRQNQDKPHVVYLMKRGTWWRIGTASVHPHYTCARVASRLASEKAEAAWILGFFATRHEALAAETLWAVQHGIPDLRFEVSQKRSLPQTVLSEIHNELSAIVSIRAARLLEERNLNASWPTFWRDGLGGHFQTSAASETVSENLLSDLMLMPVIRRGKKPAWLECTVEKEIFCGKVYGLEVLPHEHYVSGGTIVHNSVAYHCLGVGKELLTDNAESRKWLQEALQDDVAGTPAGPSEESIDAFSGPASDPDHALRLWDATRNRLSALLPVWQRADECDSRTPPYEECVRIIERYEQAKRLDHRIDFTDLLGKFSGYEFHPEGVTSCEPDGEPPKLEAWIHDEAQDMSKLSLAVFNRLISVPDCKYAYLAGDPFQCLYQFGGADHHCFMDMAVQKQRIMPKSYRCGPDVLSLGEAILRDCSDYWDRKVAPADHESTVETAWLSSGLVSEIDPRESWLVLARTNFLARKLATMLDRAGVPWVPTRGRGGWNAPVRNAAIRALIDVQAGSPIDGAGWAAILDHVPSMVNGETMLKRGSKSRFSEQCNGHDPADLHPWLMPEGLADLGATDAFLRIVHAGGWHEWIERASIYTDALSRWGEEAVSRPSVRISTVHAAKGMEADNVLMLTSISQPCVAAAQDQEGLDQETHVRYVGATRAKRRLIIARERNARWRWKMPL